MNRRLAQLAERRSQLVAHAAAQRTALEHDLAPWRARLALADQGLAVFHFIGRHPAWMVGAVLLLAALRPRHAGKWLQRGWVMWQIGRRLRSS
ncbi:MAG TPA: YqjK-like family protein [Thiobacillus sp.]|nr:YqjK-like family protein [Thiobacillus sp.]